MKIISKLTVAVVVSQVLFLTIVTVSSKNISGDNGISGILGSNFPLTLQYVGQADGKYVSQRMNRTEADAYCQASKLKQASVDSATQVTFLRQNIPEFGSTTQRYWTSARESRRDTMFVWGDGETPLNSSMVGGWWMIGGEKYCVVLTVYSSTSSELHVTTCEYNAHPLCHT